MLLSEDTIVSELKTYNIRVKFLDDLKYGEFITAPSEEEAIQLFVEEYLYIYKGDNNAVDIYNNLNVLRRRNIELEAEVATLKAQLRGGK